MAEGTITSEKIKDLRERTGVGMSKCKEALEEAKGDMEQAISILRKAGMASGVKKEGRKTQEGMICHKEDAHHIAIAEINAETDFVVKNERFQEFCKKVVDEVLLTKPASVEAFMQQKYSKDHNLTMDQLRSLLIQLIGENIVISKVKTFARNPNHSYGIYSHMGGKILTIVELDGAGQDALARDIAMHTAACAPEYVKPEEIPQEVIQKEREIAKSQVQGMQGKPAHVLEKIAENKVNDFFDQVCLLRQKYVKDGSVTVAQLIDKHAQGKKLSLVRFFRFMVGQ
jgi:elongation factor Ts